MGDSPLHDRLHEVLGDRTYRAIGDLTGQHPETVRRYMQGQAPSVDFLSAVCTRLGVCADWLLTGRGPIRSDHVRQHALREANPGELLAAIAATLESLSGRVERIEVLVQTMEVKLRAGTRGENSHEPFRSRAAGEADDRRAARVADALAERSPPAAR